MPDLEYKKRLEEQIRLIETVTTKYPITFIEGDYDNNLFLEQVKGLEKEPEGSTRCFKCYQLRLSTTAQLASTGNYDYFTTTLTVSPYKNANKINEIGKTLEKKYNIKYLYSDFKKRNGYKESIKLSENIIYIVNNIVDVNLHQKKSNDFFSFVIILQFEILVDILIWKTR